MSAIGFVLRKSGMRALVQAALGRMGYTIVLKNQVGFDSWLGLPKLPVKTILDIGACNGGFAREILAVKFPNAIIHGFEPSPLAFRLLSTVAAQSGGKIFAHQFGLGDKAGRLMFHSNDDFLPSSSLLAGTDTMTGMYPKTAHTREVEVEIRTLDEVAGALSIADDLLVKIDVQGFEDRVIEGGKNTISRARACVVEVQVAHFYQGQPDFARIFKQMQQLGFAFIGVLDQYGDDDGNILYFDAVFMKD